MSKGERIDCFVKQCVDALSSISNARERGLLSVMDAEAARNGITATLLMGLSQRSTDVQLTETIKKEYG